MFRIWQKPYECICYYRQITKKRPITKSYLMWVFVVLAVLTEIPDFTFKFMHNKALYIVLFILVFAIIGMVDFKYMKKLPKGTLTEKEIKYYCIGSAIIAFVGIIVLYILKFVLLKTY